MEAEEIQYDVVVVGGGVAGLSAAKELLRQGITKICLLEAQQRLGGRVKQVHGIAPWPLDAGAEIVHGEKSDLVPLLVDTLKMKVTPREYPNYVYWHDEQVIEYAGEQAAVTNPVVKQMYDLLDDLGDTAEEEACQDECVSEWLQARCKSSPGQRVPFFMDAYYANDIGSELAAMGMAEAAWEARNWSDGENTLVKSSSFFALVKHLARGVPIRHGWPVSAIIQHPQGSATTADGDSLKRSFVTVIGPSGEEKLSARAVICAVPVTQLQKRVITFKPPLEDSQQQLLDSITVKNAVKVWATFSTPFWLSSRRLAAARHKVKMDHAQGNPNKDGTHEASKDVNPQGPEFWDMLCPGLDFPEIWAPPQNLDAEEKTAISEPHSSVCSTHVLTAFVCASKADALSRAGASAAVDKLLAQLDLVFGEPCGDSCKGNSVGPATAAFVQGGMCDWSKEPFIEGGYSSPSKGVSAGARAALQEAKGGMLWFAGEHTHETLNSCVQGAMQTGRRAAQSALSAVRK